MANRQANTDVSAVMSTGVLVVGVVAVDGVVVVGIVVDGVVVVGVVVDGVVVDGSVEVTGLLRVPAEAVCTGFAHSVQRTLQEVPAAFAEM